MDFEEERVTRSLHSYDYEELPQPRLLIDFYNPSLTLTTFSPLVELVGALRHMFDKLGIVYTFDAEKFKFTGLGYFMTGYVHFTTRIWRTKRYSMHAVEVYRKRGDRALVYLMFDSIKKILSGDGEACFDENRILGACLDLHCGEETADDGQPCANSGIINILESQFEDVVIDGTTTVCRLISKPATLRRVARTFDFVKALVNIVLNDKLSVDNQTMAALALSKLSTVPEAVVNIVECVTLDDLAIKHVHDDGVKTVFLKRYCLQTVIHVLHLHRDLYSDKMRHAFEQACKSFYSPLRMLGFEGLLL